MELTTQGIHFYPTMRMHLWPTDSQALDPNLGAGERFRLVLVEEGNGIIQIGNHRQAFLSPCLFCLNETERPELQQNVGLRTQALFFHPNLINSAFDFPLIRNPQSGDLVGADWHDLNWLRPFLDRSTDYHGQLFLDPLMARRIAYLFNQISTGLSEQRDQFWPCRTRSYFLEILFIIERFRNIPEAAGLEPLPATSPEIEPVLLYLHTNYQHKITLTHLARQFHTNRTTLSDQFAANTGLPVNAYLIRLRVRLAALMLRNTTLAVHEVMERVGFSDNTHFGRTFRKHLGCTPSEYRQQYCWMMR